MLSLPCYLINLDRSPDRLAFMQGQLAAIGLTAERIAAVDGARLSPEQIAAAQSPFRYLVKGRTFTPGQVGCWLSHRIAWQKLVDSGAEMALILEDDVAFDPRLHRLLPDILRLSQRFDVTQLVYFNKRGFRFPPIAPIGEGIDLVAIARKTNSGGAYLLTREGARKLLSVQRMAFCNDDWEWYEALAGVSRSAVEPNLARAGVLASAIADVDASAATSRRAYKNRLPNKLHAALVVPVLDVARRLIVAARRRLRPAP